MTSIDDLVDTLEAAIIAVEKGEKSEKACCTLVGPSMKGTGIRPLAAVNPNGDKIYLLNVKQAQKLLDLLNVKQAQKLLDRARDAQEIQNET